MGSLSELSLGKVIEWLSGRKTYFMIAVMVIDELGASEGLWAPNHIRQVVELALGGMALRSAVK